MWDSLLSYHVIINPHRADFILNNTPYICILLWFLCTEIAQVIEIFSNWKQMFICLVKSISQFSMVTVDARYQDFGNDGIDLIVVTSLI